MALQNSIAKKPMEDKSIEYRINDETVRLSPSVVRNYLTNGDGRVSDAEVAYFINMCKYQKLNPLTKECYLVKYGSKPAAIIVGKDALLKRAMRNPQYAGHQAGVIVQKTETGELDYRVGAVLLEGEKLIGGWAKTYVKGYDVPIEAAVDFNEYVGRKSDGKANSMWAGKPCTMIRKVALVTSLREAFPDTLGGLYSSEEVEADFNEEVMVVESVEVEDDPQQMIVDQNVETENESFEELPGDF